MAGLPEAKDISLLITSPAVKDVKAEDTDLLVKLVGRCGLGRQWKGYSPRVKRRGMNVVLRRNVSLKSLIAWCRMH